MSPQVKEGRLVAEPESATRIIKWLPFALAGVCCDVAFAVFLIAQH